MLNPLSTLDEDLTIAVSLKCDIKGMLQAFRKNKSQLYKRYLGHRDGTEKRVCEEDEITSLIVGPLDYMAPQTSEMFWRALIGKDAIPDLTFPEGPACSVRMTFWPRQEVEPDLLVELLWPMGQRRIIIVEFKWRAPLSGIYQLHVQWQTFLSDKERACALHLFIGPEISAVLNALGQGDVWKGRLILRSWLNVLEILNHLDCSNHPGLKNWRADVTSFLAKLDIVRFQGFQHLSLPQIPRVEAVFWYPLNGFKLPAPALPVTRPTHPNHFFWSSKQ